MSVPRKHDYKPGACTVARDALAARRERYLATQKTRRVEDFFFKRTSSEAFEALHIGTTASSSDSDSEAGEVETRLHPVFRTPVAPAQKAERKRVKKEKKEQKWTSQYANKLTFSQTLPPSSDALPLDLHSNWLSVLVPEGKRCLVYTHRSFVSRKNNSYNTVLLARQSGKPFKRLLTELPPNCCLDAIYDQEQSVLWVLDVLEWVVAGLTESEASFRFFWKDAKLAELPPQTRIQSPSASRSQRAIVLPTPAYPELSRDVLLQAILPSCSQRISLPVPVVLVSNKPNQPPCNDTVFITFQSDGVIFFHKQGYYDFGPSILSFWVPSKPLQGALDVTTLKELIERQGSDSGNDTEMQLG